MRPVVRFLSDELVEKIISEGREVLCRLGVEIHNKRILCLLQEHGAKVDIGRNHVLFTNEIIDQALKAAPSSFSLYDVLGDQTHDFTGCNVYFTPGSAALNILDYHTNQIRRPTAADYIRYAKLISRLDHIASQATAFIPADVHEKISDSYRLYLTQGL